MIGNENSQRPRPQICFKEQHQICWYEQIACFKTRICIPEDPYPSRIFVGLMVPIPSPQYDCRVNPGSLGHTNGSLGYSFCIWANGLPTPHVLVDLSWPKVYFATFLEVVLSNFTTKCRRWAPETSYKSRPYIPLFGVLKKTQWNPFLRPFIRGYIYGGFLKWWYPKMESL